MTTMEYVKHPILVLKLLVRNILRSERFQNFQKTFERIFKIAILISPALQTDYSLDVYVYILNLICSSILFVITLYRAYSRRKISDFLIFLDYDFFVRITNCIELVVLAFLIPCNILFLYYIISTGLEENHKVYYGWAISCILYLAPLMKDLKKNFVVGKILDSTFFSLTRVFPFLMVICLNYMIFAIVGTYFLGGRINSDTPRKYVPTIAKIM